MREQYLSTNVSLIEERCLLCGGEIRPSYIIPDYFGREKNWAYISCRSCGLTHVYPPPSDEEMYAVYTESSKYTQDFPVVDCDFPFSGLNYLKLIESYNSNKGAKLLDIGCGYGHFLQYAQKAGYKTFGIEPSPPAVRYAKEVYGLKIACCFFEDSNNPFIGETFDVITMIGVIEHQRDPIGFLRLAYNLLSPDGLLLILTQSMRSWMHAITRDQFPFLVPPLHLCMFTPKSTRLLLRKVGLETIKIITHDVVDKAKAARALNRILRRNSLSSSFQIGEGTARSLLIASFPIRFILWKLKFGADMYILARKALERTE